MNHIFAHLTRQRAPQRLGAPLSEVAGTNPSNSGALLPPEQPNRAAHDAQIAFEQALAAYSQGDLRAAASMAARCVALVPTAGQAWKVLSAAHFGAGELESALQASERVMALLPQDAEALANHGVLLHAAGDSAAALPYLDHALGVQPSAHTHADRAHVLVRLGRSDEAQAAGTQALALDPASAHALDALGRALLALERPDDAAAVFRSGLTLAPTKPGLHTNLGLALQALGQTDAAVASCRRALELAPAKLEHVSAYLFAASQADGPLEDLLQAHRDFGARLEAPWLSISGSSLSSAHANTRDAHRRLRIGFVSGDLRTHAVAHFIEPVWRCLDAAAFEVTAYQACASEDTISTRLKGLVANWVNCAAMSDDALTARIRTDRIDILFDLSGHTAYNRLAVFARKPTPLAVSWIGYPLTTGLRAIDYRISDPFRAQPGSEAQWVEHTVRLPSSGAFEPLGTLPEVTPPPACTLGFVTFGSFHRIVKITASTLQRWAALLSAVPTARLLIGAVPCSAAVEDLTQRLGALGVARERLRFEGKTGQLAYLQLHAQVDILLDTLPYPGGTTTNLGLWMGVPTLCRTTDAALSWQSAAVMSRVGLADWIADSDEAFVRIGMAKAADLAALSALRLGARARLRSSPLYDPQHITRNLACALRQMWSRWCAGLPPTHLDVSTP